MALFEAGRIAFLALPFVVWLLIFPPLLVLLLIRCLLCRDTLIKDLENLRLSCVCSVVAWVFVS